MEYIFIKKTDDFKSNVFSLQYMIKKISVLNFSLTNNEDDKIYYYGDIKLHFNSNDIEN
jgi:hypothetical protein